MKTCKYFLLLVFSGIVMHAFPQPGSYYPPPSAVNYQNDTLAVFPGAAVTQSCLPEGITFTTQAEIDNFQNNYPGCSVIEGDVFIGETGPSSSITSLAGLSSVTRIEGFLNIYYLTNLQNLVGLENLTYIGGYLRFTSNNHLTDISALANLDTIRGELAARYSFFDDFTGFASLKYVGGDIKIVQNTGIESYNGFDSLSVVGGSLDVADNENIYDVTGFESVDSVYGRLYLRHPEAVTISGFNNLKYVGNNVIIEETGALTSITGLTSLNYVGNDLTFVNNFFLTDISGFSNLDSIKGSLLFWQAPLLVNSISFNDLKYIGGNLALSYCKSFAGLSDFQNLQSIGGGMRIYNNDRLLSLAGLSNLVSFSGDMVIHYNDSLTNLSGLDNLASINGNLLIHGNNALSSLAGLEYLDPGTIINLTITDNPLLSACDIASICDYLSAPSGIVEIHNNAPGCNKPPEVAAACGFTMSCLPFGNYYFFSQSDIDNFPFEYPGCSQLNGLVEISGSNINNLEPFSNVTSIAGTLQIQSCNYLFVLYGLHLLASIGQDFNVDYNSSLNNFIGLENLTQIGGTFKVSYNALQSFNGLENLQQIGHDMLIFRNILLGDLSGFSNLTTIGGSMSIGYNEKLLDLTGLSHLTSINGELNIYGNNILTSLQGLNNINPATITHLDISENPFLTECAISSICGYIADPGGSMEIYSNSNGCNSVEEVDSICFPVTINELNESSSITIYPNPASEEFRFIAPKGMIIFSLNINNTLGQTVLNPSCNGDVVKVSSILTGLYFVEFHTNTGTYRKKIYIRN